MTSPDEEQLKEWRAAVTSAFQALPEFVSGEWGGDKDGWGYHVEVLARLAEERNRLRGIVNDFVRIFACTDRVPRDTDKMNTELFRVWLRAVGPCPTSDKQEKGTNA